MTEAVDLAVCTIFTEGCQSFALSVCNFPAWPFGIKISRTFPVDIFRAAHGVPAGIVAFREI
jgi:hypothetical protein